MDYLFLVVYCKKILNAAGKGQLEDFKKGALLGGALQIQISLHIVCFAKI
jgi:hypothetical protein